MRPRDRALGIALGILLGVGIVVVFVFFGSEQTIDAPRINQGATTTHHAGGRPSARHHRAQGKPSPQPPPAEIPVSGGAPPESGPAHLDYHQGDRVRLRISSDATIAIELLGYGITTTATAGTPTQVAFTATKTGNFPLIVATSHIAVAEIRVAPR